MRKKITFFFLTLVLISLVSSLEVLDTTHWVSGQVWQDWDGNGIRTSDEPGFPYIQVTLMAETSSSLDLLTGPEGLISVSTAFTGSDGSFSFPCLAAGNYAIQFQSPENRPSRFTGPSADSVKLTLSNDRTGTTDLFAVESGGTTEINLGLYQFIFVNQFSLTGDQWVPSAPNTARGVVYTALNVDASQMYYRIIRGDFPGQTSDVSAGFYQGWSDENGPKIYSFSDRFSPKENVWLNITSTQMDELFMGNIYTVILGNGSFSTLARMRGQFYNFRNTKQLSAQVQLNGRNVVPTKVSTSASGMVDFEYNLDRTTFDYEVSLSGVDPSTILSIGVYGPASISTTGSLLLTLNPTMTEANVSSIPGFDQYFSDGQLYVQVNTMEYPNGQLRGNILTPQPTVLNSIFNLTNNGYSSIGRAEAVFTLDWRKAELYYYVYIEGLAEDETVTHLYNTRTGSFADLDGDLAFSHENTVKQGYFFGISQDELNDLIAGRVEIHVHSNQLELQGVLTNWF